jgi:DNA-binding NtrC family response regulator
MCRLAELDLALQDAETALARVEKCLADFESMHDVYEVAVCRRVRCQVLLALGRTSEARDDYALALKFFDSVGELFESARTRRLQSALEHGEVIWDIRAATGSLSDDEPEGRARSADFDTPVPNGGANLNVARTVEVASHGVSEGLPCVGATKRAHHPDFPRILGLSPVLWETLDLVKRSAPSSSPVLIEGETGTGKELLARAIHELSPRSGRPFIPFNCGTSTPEVFDAEICGHVRGAFTGAHGPRAGLARAAHGGTLFLDEIAELNESIQPRLLRLLDIGEIRPVGSDEVLQADVRVVAATHQDMDVAVQTKRFRSDLFFRLCTFRVRVPALRQRVDDLPILVDHFVEDARRNGYPGFAGVSPAVVEKMAKYDWPGNLRELRNEVIRLAQQSDPGHRARQWRSPNWPAKSTSLESNGTEALGRDKLLDELRLARGSVATVARRLNVSRARVYRLLKYWEVDLNIFRS